MKIIPAPAHFNTGVSYEPRVDQPLGGTQARRNFVAKVLDLCGDTRLLWLPAGTDTTTTTEASRNARVFTYDATIASRLTRLGAGYTVDFDGTDDEADVPDADNLSFGDSVRDEPFSIVALCKPDVNNAFMALLAKGSSSTVGEEYQFYLDDSGWLYLHVQDESSDGYVEARRGAAMGTSWTLLGGTYDGTGSWMGMALFKNGASVTITDNSSGTYTAMENGAALVHLGARYTTKERFFNGGIALVLLVAKALSRDEMWELKTLVNAYFNLSL